MPAQPLGESPAPGAVVLPFSATSLSVHGLLHHVCPAAQPALLLLLHKFCIVDSKLRMLTSVFVGLQSLHSVLLPRRHIQLPHQAGAA